MVYVATANNSVFAFDADNPAQAAPYWQLGPQQLGQPVPRTDVGTRIPPYHDFAKTIGITSTPVADKASGTLFFEVKSKRNGAYFHHLHAVDLATGAARNGSPKEITAQVPGTARDGNGQTVTFGPLRQLNRPGLLLMNGVVYLGYGSHGDHGVAADPNDVTYHGWVLAYRADTLAQIAAYCVSPDGNQGGIWQSGNGLTGDAGDLYIVAGNGQGAVGPRNLGNSVIKLRLDAARAQLNVVGSFTPDNVQFLDDNDLDMSSGAVLVPDGRQLVACSKEGRCYILDRVSMAHVTDFLASTLIVQPPQDERNPPESNIHAAPVFWTSPAHGLVLYVWGEPGEHGVDRTRARADRRPTRPDGADGPPAADGPHAADDAGRWPVACAQWTHEARAPGGQSGRPTVRPCRPRWSGRQREHLERGRGQPCDRLGSDHGLHPTCPAWRAIAPMPSVRWFRRGPIHLPGPRSALLGA